MMLPASQTSRRDAGYMLLELLLAVAIFAIAAYIAAPMINRRNGHRDLQTAAVLVVAELRAAQASAIKASREQSVILDPAGRRLSWGAPIRSVSLPASIGMSVRIGHDGSLQRSGDQRVQFQHDGSSNGASITLSSSRLSSTVVVDWLTGETRIATRN